MASAPTSGHEHKSLVIITGVLIDYCFPSIFHLTYIQSQFVGASRGIGRAIALAIADAVAESPRCSKARTPSSDERPPGAILSAPLLMVLISRSVEPLREAARTAEERGRGAVTARCHEMDLSDLDAVPDEFRSVLESSSGTARYDSCLLVNNAGSLGPVGLASSISSSGESNNMEELRRAVDLNVTSSIWLSSQFTRKFLAFSSKICASTTKSPLVRIVNISSLCALEPFPTMSTYCAGKAGRDMFHSVLAKEHSAYHSDEDSSSHLDENKLGRRQIFKVLNYAPGLCDTQMSQYLADSSVLDEELHKYYKSSKEENKWIRPEDTAKKLVRIMGLDDYKSGSHMDYWDV